MRISLLIAIVVPLLTTFQIPAPLPVGPAPPSMRDQWAERFEKARTFRVFHHGFVERRASFESAAPCHYLVELTYADERIDGDSALAAFLSHEVRRTKSSSPITVACRDTTSDWFEVWLDGGEDLVVARYKPAWGSLSFIDTGKRTAEECLGSRGPELFSLLAKSLPDDMRLASVVPCAAEPETVAAKDMKSVETLPEAKKQVRPSYPKKAIMDEREGVVIVQALVDTTGRVTRTKISGSTSVFDESAVRAVEQWTFKPATSNGRAVAVWVAVPVGFSLE